MCDIYIIIFITCVYRRHAVAHLVETLRNKPEGCGFDSRWCYGIFLLE